MSRNELPFLSEKMKTGKYAELACDLSDIGRYIVHIRNLNQALDHGLKLEKDHRGIKFN